MKAGLCLFAAALIACGVPTNTSVGTAQATSSAVPTTAVPAPALALCRAEQVTGTFEGWGAAAGSNVGEFRLAPIGAAACALPANPVHRFITKYGGRVLLEVPPPPPTPSPLVPLIPPAGKDSTFLTLQWSNHGAEAGWSCHDRTPVAAIEIEVAQEEWVAFTFQRDPIGICVDPVEHVFALISAPRR